MSQHGSGYGGYGGGPPAGGPPPGGAPPGYPPGGGGGYPPGGGGYPPGGGGPGYPPGGGGPGYPPGGGGPGYPPGGGGYPPGYGAPQGPPGYGPPGGGYPPGGGLPGGPPPAKKSNALMWVGLGCGGLFLLSAIGGGVAVYMAKRATENAIAAASSSLAAPLTPPVAGGGVTGTCAKAVECCIKIIQKTSPGTQNEAACLGLKQLPEANCQLPLTSYQKSAQLLGVTCD